MSTGALAAGVATRWWEDDGARWLWSWVDQVSAGRPSWEQHTLRTTVADTLAWGWPPIQIADMIVYITGTPPPD